MSDTPLLSLALDVGALVAEINKRVIVLVLGEEISCSKNLRSSFRRHWLLWELFFLTVLFDYFSTLYFMFNDGIGTEANGIVRWLAYKFGLIVGVFLGKSLQVVAAIVFVSLTQKLARAVLLLLVLLNGLAVLNNLL